MFDLVLKQVKLPSTSTVADEVAIMLTLLLVMLTDDKHFTTESFLGGEK